MTKKNQVKAKSEDLDVAKARPTDAKIWGPLPLDELTTLTASLCRSRTRVDVLDGRQPDAEKYRAAGMCGRLIHHLLEIRNRRIPATVQTPPRGDTRRDAKSITQQDLIRSVEIPERGITFSKNEVTSFLNGQVVEDRDTFWYRAAWYWIEDILLGFPKDPDRIDGDMETVFREFREYFLGRECGVEPKYFSAAARTSRGPFTQDEAEWGLRWLAWRVHAFPGSGRVVVVSGDAEIPQGLARGGFNRFGRYTADLARRGIDIYLVYPNPEVAGPTKASESVKSFAKGIILHDGEADTLEHIYPVEVPTEGNPGTPWDLSYLCPLVRFFLISHSPRAANGPPPEESIYVNRPAISGDERNWNPYAYLTSTREAEQFLQWVNGLLQNLNPKPLAKRVREFKE